MMKASKYVEESKMEKKIINPWTWQDGLGFVQAVEIRGAGRILVCAGQASIDGEGRVARPGDMGAQVRQCLDNIETVLAGAGMSLRHVVRLNYYTTDVERLLAEVCARYGVSVGPRRAAVVEPPVSDPVK